jgi:hypothetical protein
MSFRKINQITSVFPAFKPYNFRALSDPLRAKDEHEMSKLVEIGTALLGRSSALADLVHRR